MVLPRSEAIIIVLARVKGIPMATQKLLLASRKINRVMTMRIKPNSPFEAIIESLLRTLTDSSSMVRSSISVSERACCENSVAVLLILSTASKIPALEVLVTLKVIASLPFIFCIESRSSDL